MKKLLMVLAATSAALFPSMQAANAACIHLSDADPFVEVHQAECQAIIDEILASKHVGGCGFAALTDAVAGQGQMRGEMDVEAVVLAAPFTATFKCYIKVNDAAQPGAVLIASGTGVVAGAAVVTYTSNSITDNVVLCQAVDYGSNGSWESDECFQATSQEIPPQIVWDIVDGAVCPVLAAIAPQSIEILPTPPGPTVLTIEIRPGAGAPSDPGADVYVNGELFYDCPAYESA